MKPVLWVATPSLGGGGTENALVPELRKLSDTFQIKAVCCNAAEGSPLLDLELRLVPGRGPGVISFVDFYRNASRAIRSLKKAGDLVYTPGINCDCADLITVHISFHAYREAQQIAQKWSPSIPLTKKINRKIWSSLLCALEKKHYTGSGVKLTAVSHRLKKDLESRWNRHDVSVTSPQISVDGFGLDRKPDYTQIEIMRQKQNRKIVLGVGNDWQNKGFWFFAHVLAAIPQSDRPLFVVAGSENPAAGNEFITKLGVQKDILWLGVVPKMGDLYRSVDLLVAPSFEDSYALPVHEALVCGTPVLVSDKAGAGHALQLPLLAAGDLAAWSDAVVKQLRKTNNPGPSWCVPERSENTLQDLLTDMLS